jgi:hypothetical protein
VAWLNCLVFARVYVFLSISLGDDAGPSWIDGNVAREPYKPHDNHTPNASLATLWDACIPVADAQRAYRADVELTRSRVPPVVVSRLLLAVRPRVAY